MNNRDEKSRQIVVLCMVGINIVAFIFILIVFGISKVGEFLDNNSHMIIISTLIGIAFAEALLYVVLSVILDENLPK